MYKPGFNFQALGKDKKAPSFRRSSQGLQIIEPLDNLIVNRFVILCRQIVKRLCPLYFRMFCLSRKILKIGTVIAPLR